MDCTSLNMLRFYPSYIYIMLVIDAPKRCDTSVRHLHEWKLHELQHLQTLFMLWIHLWRCVTTWKVLHNIFLCIIKQRNI